jgi:hypothetical protein
MSFSSKEVKFWKGDERQRILTRINMWKGVHEEVQINSDMFNEINEKGGK